MFYYIICIYFLLSGFKDITATLGYEAHVPNRYRCYQGLAYSIRERLIQSWLKTQQAYYDSMVKRVYYLSMEFLPGRFLMNYLTNMNIQNECSIAVESLGVTLEELEEVEFDAGLGNGGLGRLASCYLDSMADLINRDPEVNTRLRVLFLPNYCISQAEKVIPAADLSEQISTAGYEASGTGNMKFSLNGALTIGTMDGANVEIMEEVGEDNIFIFGLKAEEVSMVRREGYDPLKYYESDPELKQTLDMIAEGWFSPSEPDLFKPIIKSLLQDGDKYVLLADFRAYMHTQEKVDALYEDQDQWVRKAILNTAGMGKFSSDRSVMEYARRIWKVEPLQADQLQG